MVNRTEKTEAFVGDVDRFIGYAVSETTGEPTDPPGAHAEFRVSHQTADKYTHVQWSSISSSAAFHAAHPELAPMRDDVKDMARRELRRLFQEKAEPYALAMRLALREEGCSPYRPEYLVSAPKISQRRIIPCAFTDQAALILFKMMHLNRDEIALYGALIQEKFSMPSRRLNFQELETRTGIPASQICAVCNTLNRAIETKWYIKHTLNEGLSLEFINDDWPFVDDDPADTDDRGRGVPRAASQRGAHIRAISQGPRRRTGRWRQGPHREDR